MGQLLKGQWQATPVATQDKTGHFVRVDSAFRDWISTDGDFPAEPNRYHLYVSYACPWASRTLIFRQLKDLTNMISFSVVSPDMFDHGWEFGEPGSELEDVINHQQYLYQIYLKANPTYTGKVTVPILWDKTKQTIVSNESADIIRMLNSEFNHLTGNTDDYYPQALRADIDAVNELVYEKINNGVYRCGFATTQSAYEEAFDDLFAALDQLDNRLGQHTYLVGDILTEADWRLFVTLIRFDVVYVGHFKCNLKRIIDYPNLSSYLRKLYEMPGIKETVNFEHIKRHYYHSHASINPTQIVPKGPAVIF